MDSAYSLSRTDIDGGDRHPRHNHPTPAGVKVLDTSEVRWFAFGALPPQLVEWFTTDRNADVEVRTDTYRHDPSHALGVKRRNGGPIEVKVLHSRRGRLQLGRGVGGRVEEWRKIVPGDTPENELPESHQWRGVHKVILTCTYAPLATGGAKLVDRSETNGTGCDIELASVSVEGVEAWTFALEAWGPVPVRRALLESSLAALFGGSQPPQELTTALIGDMGYPEWLASIASNSVVAP
jgi:hypothetical protein